MKKLVLEQRLITEYDPVKKEMNEVTMYKVTKVINSINPKIGANLVVSEVDAYCEDVAWNVEITGVK